ncbi:RNA polymerase sigma factor [Pedobacter sp. L105]|uniref:RNA polymerase sigma factor n=1 Tax=Pedobacter sp. L105 TaxID=1641871 RepID=UPI00131DC674|nr:RNA polymerase sigma-70 factor [Pedobacter sp. L105]
MIIYGELSDVELISLIREDDQNAFAEIYSRYKAVLYIHAFNLLRDREESKDILQQIFAALWSNRKDFKLESQLAGYLYTAVRNTIFKVIAHKQVESKYISSLAEFIQHNENATDHLVRQNQLSLLIEKEISQLPEKMREVFELSRKLNYTHKEIASKLGISEKTVKNQVNNALKILRLRFGVFIYLLILFNLK